jgi:hypothetical protein
MTQEAMKKMYQLLLTEPHAPTVCAQLERIAREALAEHAMREVQRLGQEIEQAPVAHCEAGPNYCWKCLEESNPTYGSEEIKKLREVNKSLMKNIEELKKEPPPFWPVVQHLLDEYGLQFIDIVAAYRESTQPEQEPVAWLSTDSIGERYLCFDKPLDNDPVQPLNTAPPQRKPLTDKAITKVIDSMPKKMKGFMVDWDLYEFARAIEAAHGIKENT